MPDLLEQVRSFLNAEGFTVSPRASDLLYGNKRSIAEDTEEMYVWVPQLDPNGWSVSREPGFLARFQDAANQSPQAIKWFVVPTLEGLSNDFRSGALRWHGVRIRTPIRFFDTEFKWEVSGNAASASKDLRDRGVRMGRRRVPQPFQSIDGGPGTGQDLLTELETRLSNTPEDGRTIHFVVGPAGAGKSYLFETLFAKMYERFMDYKNRGGPRAARPLPLLPELLQIADSANVSAILNAYLQTEFARPLLRETFEFMVANSIAVWMLDGLDEVVAHDPQFFDYLLDLQTRPNSGNPTVLVCIRDSLLASNEDLRDYLELSRDQIALYELTKWDRTSKRRYGDLFLEGSGRRFVDALERKETINELASTPFYCTLLGEQYSEGNLIEHATESELLEYALDTFIDRDIEKGFIDRDLIPREDIVAFYESLATEDMRNGFAGISTEVANEWADVVLPARLETEQREKFARQLVYLGVFSEGQTGNLRFSQEILEQYLLGKRLIWLFDSDRGVLISELAARVLPAEWITVRILADHVRTTESQVRLAETANSAVGQPIAFKNLVQIAAMSIVDPGGLQSLNFERASLVGIRFERINFAGKSFREADLRDVTFESCRLSDANFDGAILRNTSFVGLHKGDLGGAEFGGLERFFSVRTDRNLILDDHETFAAWVREQTGAEAETRGPCPAAMQLRGLFTKFVHPTGERRRARINMRGALAGKRHHEDPEEVLEATIRRGYLVREERFRDRLHRPPGDLYAEIVGYVTELRVSAGLRSVLGDVCRVENCVHVPTSH